MTTRQRLSKKQVELLENIIRSGEFDDKEPSTIKKLPKCENIFSNIRMATFRSRVNRLRQKLGISNSGNDNSIRLDCTSRISPSLDEKKDNQRIVLSRCTEPIMAGSELSAGLKPSGVCDNVQHDELRDNDDKHLNEAAMCNNELCPFHTIAQ